MGSIFSTPKAPTPPNPYTTANAQTQSNTQTAITQALLNMVNQKDAYGSTLNYSKSGSYTIKEPVYDKNGRITSYRDVAIPQFTATTTLSPEQQALLGQTQQFDKLTNEIALNQGGRIKDVLSEPINLSNDAVESRLMELGRKRLDPVMNEREAAMEAKLTGQGLAPGSAAYDRAMRGFNEGRNDAYNNLLLSGRQQSINEILTGRNQPLNETASLINGQQIGLPQWTNTPQTGVQGTNTAGLISDNYNQRLGLYNQQVGQQNAAMGGIFGLGGALLGSPWAGNMLGGWK
jgi:hypothetical protein